MGRELVVAELDGVPAFWVEQDGPLTATLTFRVGTADEQLVTRGITHLTEHLVLAGVSRRELEVNGAVSSTLCMFWVTGPPAAVGRAIGDICARLRAVPVERLQAERGVLLTESNGNRASPILDALAICFGAQSYGLPAYSELGLYRLSADDVRAWSSRHFTRGNLVLSLLGPLPSELVVDLPAGPRIPAPTVEPPLELTGPVAQLCGPSGGTSLSFLAERSSRLSLAVEIAERRLSERLREELGVSYTVSAIYTPLGVDHTFVTLFADCHDTSAPRLANELINTLNGLVADRPEARELDEAREAWAYWAAQDGALAPRLQRATYDALHGRPYEPLSTIVERQALVTPARAAAALAGGLSTSILSVPAHSEGFNGARLVGHQLAHTPPAPCRPVDGRRFRGRGRRAKKQPMLTVGQDGVSFAVSGALASVAINDIAAVVKSPSGERLIISRDGTTISVDPNQWRDGRELTAAVDAVVPPDTAVETHLGLEALIDEVIHARGRETTYASELQALLRSLEPLERIDALVEASNTWHAMGLLVLSDRRVLYLRGHEIELSVSRAGTHAVVGEEATSNPCAGLTLTTQGETHVFADLEPRAELDKLVDALTPES